MEWRFIRRYVFKMAATLPKTAHNFAAINTVKFANLLCKKLIFSQKPIWNIPDLIRSVRVINCYVLVPFIVHFYYFLNVDAVNYNIK